MRESLLPAALRSFLPLGESFESSHVSGRLSMLLRVGLFYFPTASGRDARPLPA